MQQLSPEMKKLEEHTFLFAQAVREFGKKLPNTVSNVEDLKMLIRASGAVGAATVSAHSALNKTDYLRGIHLSGTEARHTHYWLRLVDTQGAGELEARRAQLLKAAEELLGVFAGIVAKTNQ
jgi:four helix bundle protein